MAKSALDQLQEQIEAIRREAYAAGYGAAMEAVRDFTGRAASGAPAPAPQSAPATAAPRQRGRRQQRQAPPSKAANAGTQAPQRGGNARLVEEVLRSMAPRPARPADIRNVLRRDRGVVMAFTSIRHALNQLAARDVIEQIDDTKTWRLRGQTGSATKGG